MATVNRFIARVSVSPRGVVKISEGLGSRTSLRSASVLTSNLSIVQNFKTAQDDCSLYELSPDSPEAPELKPGHGLLGNKQSMSKRTSIAIGERMAAQELEHGRENLLFCTFTLPGGGGIQFETLARWSSYAVNRLSQWLRDNLGTGNYTRCGVWEYQKRGALHYHLCLGFYDGCMPPLLCWFRKRLSVAWMQTLNGISGESGVEMLSGRYSEECMQSRLLDYEDLGKRFVNVQPVEKSVAAYLSSYLAESNHGGGKNALRSQYHPIATWAQWDRAVTAIWRKHTREVECFIDAACWSDWVAVRDAFLSSVPVAKGTRMLDVSNPWWSSHTLIAGCALGEVMDLVRDFVRMVKVSGIVRGFWDCVYFARRKESTRNFEVELGKHERDLWNYDEMRNSALTFATPFYWDVVGLMRLANKCLIELQRNPVPVPFPPTQLSLPLPKIPENAPPEAWTWYHDGSPALS